MSPTCRQRFDVLIACCFELLSFCIPGSGPLALSSVIQVISLVSGQGRLGPLVGGSNLFAAMPNNSGAVNRVGSASSERAGTNSGMNSVDGNGAAQPWATC